MAYSNKPVTRYILDSIITVSLGFKAGIMLYRNCLIRRMIEYITVNKFFLSPPYHRKIIGYHLVQMNVHLGNEFYVWGSCYICHC